MSRDLSALENWRETVLARLPDNVKENYRPPELLSHYIRTANMLYDWTSDIELGQAAFLHGVRDLKVLHAVDLDLSPAVREILEGRAQLRSLDPADPDTPRNLVQNVLPHLADSRAAVLLVFERLDHFDPNERWANFTRNFYDQPSAPESVSQPHFALTERMAEELTFLQSVVAPTARYCGLWLARNRAEDIALYFSRRNRFNEILQFTKREDVIEEVRCRVQIIAERLSDSGFHPHWEWHHIGSLDRKLPSNANEFSPSRLTGCGIVTVICDLPEQCYKVLGRLHLSPGLSHQSLEMQDHMGQPGLSGYEAIHTAVTPHNGKTIRVRIIPAKSQVSRMKSIEPERLAAIRSVQGKDSYIRVYAYDGRELRLPTGSVVLNFCKEIHTRMVVHATGALVNRERVPLLHRLEEGDVVRLEYSDEPRPLPTGWDKIVPPQTIPAIKDAFRSAFKPGELAYGRKELKRLLREANVSGDDMDDATLDGFLENAVNQLHERDYRFSPVSAHHWLRLLSRTPPSEQDRALLQQVLDTVIASLRQTRNLFSAEALSIDRSLLAPFESIRICEICSPSVGQAVVGVVMDGDLFIHRTGSRCGQGGTRVSWTRRVHSLSYFVFELDNRLGVAAAVLAKATTLGLDVVDVAGSRLGPGWAVLRIQTSGVRTKAMPEVRAAFRSVPGVLNVFVPGDPPAVMLEGILPPRRRSVRAVQQPLIFQAGGEITEDERFYGREGELGELGSLFSRMPTSAGAISCAVAAPLKTGKTSLILSFLRSVRREEFGVNIISTTCMAGHGWRQFADSLSQTLERALRQARLSLPADLSLQQLVDQFPDRLLRPLILFIDEATGMFAKAHDRGEAGELMMFLRWLTTRPGVMLIWAGPEAPTLRLKSEAMEEFRRCQFIHWRPWPKPIMRDLLAAAKLTRRGRRIIVDRELAGAVRVHTGGNPYWANLMAKCMLESKPPRGDIDFSMDDFPAACESLALNSLAFADRTFDCYQEDPAVGAIPALLRVLAEAGSEGRSTEELFEVWDRRISRCSSLFSETIDLLRARGSIRPAQEGVWKIDSPALARFIVTYRIGK